MSRIESGPIQLAFTADSAYLPHAAAMVDSMLEQGDAVDLHLVHGPELAPPEIEAFERWLGKRGVCLTRHPVTDELVRDLPERHFHRSVWYRILLPELLPGLDRVLYLDADTLVLDRLRPLWETDLAGHLFGAVTNPLYPFMENGPLRHLGLPSAGCYLNSGVLLMNLERMRQEKFVATLRSYAARHPENRYPEQDALSALFHNRCAFLHPRWNVQTTFFDLAPGELPFSKELVQESRDHPAIVHFIGPYKPDHYLSRHPYGTAYLRHRRNTPWPASAQKGRSLVNLALRRLPMAWQFRYFVARAALMQRLR